MLSRFKKYAARCSAGIRKAYRTFLANPELTTIELKRAPVKNGKVEIGFRPMA